MCQSRILTKNIEIEVQLSGSTSHFDSVFSYLHMPICISMQAGIHSVPMMGGGSALHFIENVKVTS